MNESQGLNISKALSPLMGVVDVFLTGRNRNMLTAQKTKAPPQDTGKRYYHIPKGCAAEARPLTGGEWRIRCPERDLWLPVTGYEGLDLLFRDGECEWRVAGEIVGYC